MAILQVEHMTHYFGGLRAVHDYNLQIERGQIRGLIGPNGAGKTTIFNLLTGIYRPTEGKITLDGVNIVGLPPHQIASKGLGRTFQNLRLWRHMTVLEHVKQARYSKLGYGLMGAFFGTARRNQEEAENEQIALDLLDLVGIRHLANQVVTNLPYGAQRKVETARALATEPKILFLDEPTAGMNPEELREMVRIFRRVHEELDLTIFLIEHRMKVVMELCDMIQTLVFGAVIAEGPPDEIRSNPAVIDAYLGKEVET
ncbi:MAG: high-affinity branched-chain amino acid ABC transporter ATP-binding protein LivG [Candidatus Anoxymicrobium japonicum]|uniref:High-affinity branched-chain amino acid ABC transporter ATP-binding protein LivG n=1 Tax=Candidatus Anoxymicrobium japonicum TaxID=2013648 RepID=A0A2N3G456_9ACTN|nr:MAG: high-affinity branched-chain amino acid ABC transporter ATP-binding protein LivG [Candidatus Anoxymicrobium japonicum]